MRSNPTSTLSTPGQGVAQIGGATILPNSIALALTNALLRLGCEPKGAQAIAEALTHAGPSQLVLVPSSLLRCLFLVALGELLSSSSSEPAPVSTAAPVPEGSCSLSLPLTLPLPLAGSSGGAGCLPPGTLSLAGAEDSPKRPLIDAFHVRLQGTLGRGGHVLIINHTIRIELQLNQFLLMLTILCHSLCQASLPAPITVLGGDYLKADRIVKIIDQLKRTEPGLRDLPDLGTAEIHHAKWGLTRRLKANGVNPALIETLRGSGYRLALAPTAIVIILSDDDEPDQVWPQP